MKKTLHAVLLLALTVAGCASDPSGPTTRPSSAGARAERDPMKYRPEFDKTDISGGGMMNYDSKGMKSDLDSIFMNK